MALGVVAKHPWIKIAEECLTQKHPNDVEIMNFSPWLFTSIENLHTMSFGAPAQELSKKSVTPS